MLLESLYFSFLTAVLLRLSFFLLLSCFKFFDRMVLLWNALCSYLNNKYYRITASVLVFVSDDIDDCLQVYPEGTHLMIPWFERSIIYDVRARPHLVESTSGSRDLQMVIYVVLLNHILIFFSLVGNIEFFFFYQWNRSRSAFVF